MPKGRKPDGEHALSNAERRARHRARHATQRPDTTIHSRGSTDQCSRPQRWRNAIDELLALQAEYATWLDALPDRLRTLSHGLRQTERAVDEGVAVPGCAGREHPDLAVGDPTRKRSAFRRAAPPRNWPCPA